MVTQSLLNQISSIDNLDDLMYLNEFVMNTRNQLGKNTLSVGSKVWVVQKTKRTEGVITKMKVKKALVEMNGMLYNVPFSMLVFMLVYNRALHRSLVVRLVVVCRQR